MIWEEPVEVCDWPDCSRQAVYSDAVDGVVANWWCRVHHDVREHRRVEWCGVHRSTYPVWPEDDDRCLFALLWKTDPALARCSRVWTRMVLEPLFEWDAR